MAEANVGSASIKLRFDASGITGVEGQLEKSAKSGGSKWGSAWAVAAGNIISNAISKIGATITKNLDTAIKRVDTLANSNVVFEALGYSAESTAETMSTLNDYLDGLPTSMTDAVAGVQSLSASFGGIEKGTEAFIDMNNAGLAFGATSDQIANAITQLGQLSMDGPLDAATWNSLRNSGFGPVFAAMAKEAGTTVGELKESFSGNGDKTVGDFLASLHRLSTEGGADMEALSSIAQKNTAGIGTAMENLSNRTGKAIANVLDTIGQQNISGLINSFSSMLVALTKDGVDVDMMIDNLSDQIDIVFDGLISAVAKLAPRLVDVTDIIGESIDNVLNGLFNLLNEIDLAPIFQNITRVIMQNIPALLDLLTNLAGEIINSIVAIVQEIAHWLPDIIPSLVNAITVVVMMIARQLPTILRAIVDGILQIAIVLTQPENLQAILTAGIELLMALVDAIPDIIVALINALPTIIENIIAFLTDPATIGKLIEAAVKLFMALVAAVPQILGALFAAWAKLFGDLWNKLSSIFGTFAAKFGKAIGNAIAGAINGVIGFIEGVLNGPINAVNGLIGALNAIPGVNIGKLQTIKLGRVALAEGGVVNSPTTALIGEAGREAVIPLEQNTGNWAGLLASKLAEEFEEQGGAPGSVINVYFNNQINSRLDINEVNQELLTAIRRAA